MHKIKFRVKILGETAPRIENCAGRHYYPFFIEISISGPEKTPDPGKIPLFPPPFLRTESRLLRTWMKLFPGPEYLSEAVVKVQV